MKNNTLRRWLSALLALAMILSCAPVTLAAEDGIVVHYEFTNDATDSSGNGYNGTLVKGASVADGSVKLTGGSKTNAAGVDIPSAAFTGLTDYTMEMDVKLDKTVKWTQLFTMGNGSNYLVLANQGDPSGVQVGLTMAAKLGGGEQRVKSGSPDIKLPVGKWARMTYTQSGTTASLYINGVLVGTSTITITPSDLAKLGLGASIGRSLMFPDPGMEGLVDEFVLYNYGMTAQQVKESYDKKFGPIVYYDFEDVSDDTVKDITGNGYDATLVSGASVTDAMSGKALSLSSGSDYLKMPDFLAGLTDVTFSGFVKLDQVANWTTLFAAGVKGGKCITWAVRGNPARNEVGYTLAINNGAGSEQRVAATTEHIMPTGEWIHFVYAQEGSSARLYLDGVQVDSLSMLNNNFITHGDNMTNTFSNVAGAGPLMLGKSVWPDPDAYGLFDEIKVYNRALTELEIQAITNEFALKIAYEALDLGDLERVTTNLELPKEGAKGAVITWKSDKPEVLDATGKLSPDFEGEQTVTLTATITIGGQSVEKVFVANVHPLSEEEKAQLLLDEEVAYIEAAIDFLINDGYTLPTGKNGTVVYTVAQGDAKIEDGKVYKTETSAERQALTLEAAITVGETTREVELDNITLIDPYVGYILSFFGANGTVDAEHSGVNNKDEKARIAYSYDGIHWAVLNNNYPVVYPTLGSTKRVRDPFIMRNKDGSFSLLATQGWDTPYIYIWYSENLTEFTNERLLKVSQAGVEGLTGSRAWAPEADYDRITDQYYIYWADPSAGPIYYNTSSDLETVSAPSVYFDPGYQVIDSNIVKDGDTYYMAFKDERGSGKRMKFAKSGSLQANTWEVYTPDFVTGMNSEGPFVYQDIHNGKWVMYWDFFYGASNERFGYSFTDDLASGEWDYQGTNPYMPSTDVRHGGVVPVTQKEMDAILAKWETTTVRNVVQAAENTAACEGPAPFASLALPETANVYLDNGEIAQLPVTWSAEGYEEKLGQQQLTGTITLPEGYTNTGNIQPILTLEITEYTGASEDDIVLRYDFEGIQGYTVTDTSGNGYDGTIVSSDSSIRTGIVGSALDIGNGYVSIPAEAIQGLTDVTVVAQVYIEDSAATANRTKPTTLFSAGYGNKQQAYFMLNTQSFNLSQHNLLEGCGYTIHTPSFLEKRFAAPVDTVAVPGQWNTLVMTQRGTTVKFYLNGELVFTKEDVTATMGDVYAGADTPVLLGGSVWNDAAPDGWYDSFTIYNKAMTDDQIPTGTGLVLDYQFEGMTAADTTVDDLSGNGYDGTLVSTDATVVSGEFGDALDIGSGHVKIPAAAIQGLTDVTVVAQIYIDSRVSTGDIMKPTTLFSAGYGNKQKAYFMLNTQSFDFGKYHEGCGYTIHTPSYSENRIAAPVESHAQEGQWNTIAMTQSGTTVKIYLNGELVRTEENVTATMGDVYAGEDTPVLLGGSVWGDYVPDGRYEYFRIYDRALAPEEIPLPQVETPVVVLTPFEETVDYIERAVDFLINDGNTLPQSKDEDFTVEWSLISGDARIVDGKLCKTETSAERQAVVLQAVVTGAGEGESATLKFENVTLIDPYVGYVLSFFGAGGTVDSEHSGVNNKDEKFRMAYSYDGIHWAQLNSNFPVIYPESGNGRTRDPAIMRNKDGSFTVLATQGWDTPSIYLWHSEYLTEFTDERLLQATVKGPYGLTGSRAWAPEGTYDPITDRYFIYWSDPSANGSRGATYFNTSEDLQTLSEPGVLFDPGYRHLDANIIKYDGSYYLDFRHYSAYNTEGLSGIRFAQADRLAPGEFTAYTEDVNPYRTDSAAEGSFVFKVNGENKWYLYWDYNDIGKFGVMQTTDLASGQWTYLGINQYMPHSNVRHGGAIPVTQKELDAIIAKWETSSVRNVVQAAETTATVSGPVYFEDLTLPETANMYLDNGQIVELPVVWSSEGYEVKLGQQQLSGTIVLPEGYSNTGNVAAVLTLTVVADTQAPVITGVEEGKTYCDTQTVTVQDNNLACVTVNGEKVSLVGSSFRTIPGTLTIVATDLAGNTASVTITVNDGHTYLDTVVEPTCTQSGYTNHVCDICGDSYVSSMTAPKGHSYQDTVTQPTHDMMGYTTHTCACGHSYIDSFVAALDHDFVRTVTKEATCTENGELTFACQCGESYTMILPRLDHSYTAETVEATCESIGYTVYTCQCGHSYVGDLTAALGHDYQSVVTAPTCVSLGYTTHTCACGSTYVDALTPSLGHGYESVVTEPTHEKMGYTTHTCACGHSYVDSYTDALDHDYVQSVTKEATCTENGELTFACQCGESYTMVIPKADHSYTASVTEPTHTDLGYTTYTCQCGKSYVDALVPAIGHSYEALVTEPTCGSVGYTTYVCSCGDSFVDDLTPALGHSHDAVITEPTCVSWGYTTYTCACGDNYVSSLVPATGHSYESVVTEPTCVSMGYTTHTCANCGDSYVDTLVDLLPHSHVGTVTTAPTCVSEGVMTYTCACGDSYTQIIPKSDHEYEAVVTEPQCGLYGFTTYTCVSCGFSYVSDMTAPGACPSLAFTDVHTGTWYHAGLDYVISRGIMRGVSETEFAPHSETTRAMLATLLYRAAGEPSVEALDNPFTDVAPGRYYTDAVIWAAHVGVVKGVTEDTFNPEAPITREQMVTMIYRFAGSPETTGSLKNYTDAGKVSPYAREAMAWAVANGIITGDTRTTLNPTGTATRAMIATVLMRYLSK